jgi:hypothetical protein
MGDLISYRNGGKRLRAMADKAERTVSEYAWLCIKRAHVQRPLFGMSAFCSLDELRKPSFVEHRFRLLPPSQIAQASSGVRQPPGHCP